MRIPRTLVAVIVFLLLLGVADFILRTVLRLDALGDIGNLVLTLTLVVLILYAYYTYVLAKETLTPSASFLIHPYPGDPFHFMFTIQNHSKPSLQCWCNLNLSINGLPVALDGFYGGSSSFDIQPFGAANGHFDLREFITRTNWSLEQLVGMARTGEIRNQLRFNLNSQRSCN